MAAADLALSLLCERKSCSFLCAAFSLVPQTPEQTSPASTPHISHQRPVVGQEGHNSTEIFFFFAKYLKCNSTFN